MIPAASTLRKITLHGHLAEHAGPEHHLSFTTPMQAIRLLDLNYPGFLEKFKEGYYWVSAVFQDNSRDLTKDTLGVGFTGDLVLMPTAYGNNSNKRKGIIGALLGALIIGAALVLSGGALGLALPGILGATGATFGTVAGLGLSLVAKGIALALTPTPETKYTATESSTDSSQPYDRSFVFNGPTNVTTPGGVLPVVYGEMTVGTITASAAIDVEMVKARLYTSPRNITVQLTRPTSRIYLNLEDLLTAPDDHHQLYSVDGNIATAAAEWVKNEISVGVYLSNNPYLIGISVRNPNAALPNKVINLPFAVDVSPEGNAGSSYVAGNIRVELG